MPELPEVETIRRELEPHLVGRRMVDVHLPHPEAVRHPSPDLFRSRLLDRRLERLWRRGKYLLMELDRGSLIFHLKMTGALLFSPDGVVRASFLLDDGRWLYFSDRRKLGGIWLVEDPSQVIGGLGPEPLEDSFTPQALGERLQGRRAPLKALLTDQSFLAGVGNMYADEALFQAGIHPLRPGGELSPPEVSRLHRAIREVLLRGIAAKGATIADYRRPNGSSGRAQEEFRVPRQEGKPCPACSTPIERLPLRGRGTYFCPRCQGLSSSPPLSLSPSKERGRKKFPKGLCPFGLP